MSTKPTAEELKATLESSCSTEQVVDLCAVSRDHVVVRVEIIITRIAIQVDIGVVLIVMEKKADEGEGPDN